VSCLSKIKAQISLSEAVIDSISIYDYDLGTELINVSFYNQIIKSENLMDTIDVQLLNGEVVYRYKKQEIKDLSMRLNNDSPIKMRYSKSRQVRHIHAIVKKNESEYFNLFANPHDECDPKIQIENYMDSILIGDFREKCLSGKIL